MIEFDNLSFALDYAMRDFRVFPLHSVSPDGTCTCKKEGCTSQGKHPRTEHGVKDATQDENQISEWWSKWPDANIGIATGNGLIVVDIDPKNGGTIDQLGSMPEPAKVKTGSGGYHFYFTYDQAISLGNTAGRLGKGIDTRADGGYVVAPQSLHMSGSRYEWMDEKDPVPLPDYLLQKLTSKPARVRQDEGTIPEGKRNDTLFRVACSLRGEGYTTDGIIDELRDINQERCNPPLLDEEIEKIATSAGTYPPNGEQREVDTFHLSDVGNAKRLVARYGHKIRYVKQWGWMIWDGKRWKQDETEQVTDFAKETVLSIYQEASQIEDETVRRATMDHARQSESASKINGLVGLAKSERQIVAYTNQFDSNPFLLNCQNGTVDLQTGELRPHNPLDCMTKLAPVEYNVEAQSGVWDSFIDQITSQNKPLQEYLQRVVGYSLTGSTKEEAFFILWGSGRNGKSKFIEAIRSVLGEYARNTNATTFMRRRDGNGPTNDLADLAGARLVTTVETESGKSLDVNLIKQATGGDVLTARYLYKDNFEFKPQYKILMATNNKPEIPEDTTAIWERVKLIPFTVDFTGREDKDLSEKLKKVTPAILKWAVDGCLMWQRDGLKEPEVVKAATQEYREEQDLISDFLLEKCETGEEHQIKARHLYTAYTQWCDRENEKAISEKQFASRMIAHGLKKTRSSQGVMYLGIKQKEVPIQTYSSGYRSSWSEEREAVTPVR